MKYLMYPQIEIVDVKLQKFGTRRVIDRTFERMYVCMDGYVCMYIKP